MTSATTVKLGCLVALTLAVSLQAASAPRFSPDNQPLGSIAPLVLSNADLSGGATKGYRPWFENGSWQGDLVEYTVTKDGGLSTSVSFTQSSPTNTGSNWSALVNFAARNQETYWDTDRKIITFNGGTQVPFRFNNEAGIGAANMARLDPDAEEDASIVLNFVRGERSNEFPDGAQLRHRTSILGDIIHSRPVYVGAPNDVRTENDYADWAKKKKDRAARVYVGANDGMLHVFDAATGDEVYAYVPSMLMEKLRLLTARPYPHAYYVDGEMSVRDAHFGGAWHTVLAGSLGAGGKGFFILDITDPDLNSERSTAPEDKKVLFEHTTSIGSPDDDLGDSFSRPVIAKLNDDNWYVITGNGYNSVNGVAMLYLVNLDTLTIRKLATGPGTPDNPKGLSSPSLLDTDRDGKADYAYAGDIDGNLWKFDLTAKNSGGWKVAYNGVPLHPTPTGRNQAITQAPQITLHPRYGYMLYFATGRLFTADDLEDTSIQSLYGIWDSGKTPPDKQVLLEQTWYGPGPEAYRYQDGSQTIAIYKDSDPANWNTHHGWKVDFPAGGYRVLQPVQVRANRVMATVYKPIEGAQGENWLVQALLSDGGPNPANAPIYDLNVDKELDAADLYYSNAGDGVEKWRVPMMWQQADGIMSQATIGYIRSGRDTLFINYLQPRIPSEPCTEDCPKGFFNGHIDVETYLGYGANGLPPDHKDKYKYKQHTHNYDKLTRRVYVDFFNLYDDQGSENPSDNLDVLRGHVEIDSTGDPAPSSGIDPNEEFIVLVANADFSPGGTLQVGTETETWNVLDYQIQIHKALKKWDPHSGIDPVDDNGDPLVFKWGDIKAAGGTIRVSFNDRTILDGGLHPTQPQCVILDAKGEIDETGKVVRAKTYDPVTKIGRWRNGALTIQLVKKSYFTDQPGNSAIAMVDIQKPNDLVPELTTDSGAVLTTWFDYNGDGNIDEDEQFGGLLAPLAPDDAAHLWESSMFWHFGGLSGFTSLGAPCYGEANWAEAVALEQDNNAITATLAALGYNELTAETLAAEVEALRLQGCDVAGADCYSRWKILRDILYLSDAYTQPPNDNGDNGDPDTPAVIEGGSTGAGLEGDGGDGSITEGSTFQPGRMSWTDIVK